MSKNVDTLRRSLGADVPRWPTPRTARGRAQVDVWALGVLIWELLSLRPAWADLTVSNHEVRRICTDLYTCTHRRSLPPISRFSISHCGCAIPQAFRHAILVEHRRLPPPELSCFPASAGGLPALAEAGRVSGLLGQIFEEDPARRPTMAQVPVIMMMRLHLTPTLTPPVFNFSLVLALPPCSQDPTAKSAAPSPSVVSCIARFPTAMLARP